MLYYLRIIGMFLRVSWQQEAAYRANFAINLFHSLLSLLTGVLGIAVLFGQVKTVQGWTFASTLVILGVYLTMNALRRLFITPSFDALAGLEGEIWTGRFDYAILRPLDTQFLTTFWQWRPFALLDLLLGIGVLIVGTGQINSAITLAQAAAFGLMMAVGLFVLYSALLIFAALVFWSPGFLFGWVFEGIFQMARYPVNVYPGWIRLILTWIIPVSVITTMPAQALTGEISPWMAFGSLSLGVLLFAGASMLFHRGLRRYASASS